MVFTSYWFLGFYALLVLIYFFLRIRWARMSLLLVASIVFELHYAGIAAFLSTLLLGVIVYLCGCTGNRRICELGMVAAILWLVYYKYTTFLLSNGVDLLPNSLRGALNPESGVLAGIVAPLGISFFVFEFVHYLFDVRKGSKPIFHPIEFAMFGLFFPSLVAGPIKRYQIFLPEVWRSTSSHGLELGDVAVGLARMLTGYFKKAVVGDNLNGWTTEELSHYASDSLLVRWLAFIGIGLRIYMDFSGYSDIAIGAARSLGIRLPENFNWPYSASSIQEFRTRWHISLSSWIRDYIYIPLGGNRVGKWRVILNGLTAFALCGFWHGAAWNFVLWGVYHGVGLGINNVITSWHNPVSEAIRTISQKFSVLSWFVTQFFVFTGWLLFFFPVGQALTIFKCLFVL